MRFGQKEKGGGGMGRLSKGSLSSNYIACLFARDATGLKYLQGIVDLTPSNETFPNNPFQRGHRAMPADGNE